MFEQMQISEQMYRGQTPLKNQKGICQLWHPFQEKRGSRIRLNYQPLEVPHWQAQDKTCSLSKQEYDWYDYHTITVWT